MNDPPPPMPHRVHGPWKRVNILDDIPIPPPPSRHSTSPTLQVPHYPPLFVFPDQLPPIFEVVAPVSPLRFISPVRAATPPPPLVIPTSPIIFPTSPIHISPPAMRPATAYTSPVVYTSHTGLYSPTSPQLPAKYTPTSAPLGPLSPLAPLPKSGGSGRIGGAAVQAAVSSFTVGTQVEIQSAMRHTMGTPFPSPLPANTPHQALDAYAAQTFSGSGVGVPMGGGQQHSGALRPWLGLEATEASDSGGNPCLSIVSITPGGSAAAAALQPGDLLLRWNDRPLRTRTDIGSCLDQHQVGSTIQLLVSRAGRMVTVPLTLKAGGGGGSTVETVSRWASGEGSRFSGGSRTVLSKTNHGRPAWHWMPGAEFDSGDTKFEWLGMNCAVCDGFVEGTKYIVDNGDDETKPVYFCENCYTQGAWKGLYGTSEKLPAVVAEAPETHGTEIWIGWQQADQPEGPRPVSLRLLLSIHKGNVQGTCFTPQGQTEWKGVITTDGTVTCSVAIGNGNTIRKDGKLQDNNMKGVWEYRGKQQHKTGCWQIFRERVYMQKGAFLRACRRGDIPTVKQMLEQDKTLATKSWGTCLPLIDVCTLSKRDAPTLYEIHHPNCKCRPLQSDPLHRPYAVQLQAQTRRELIDILLAYGADPCAPNQLGQYPLNQLLLLMTDNMDQTYLRLKQPARQDKVNKYIEPIDWLLKKGANPNQFDAFNVHPLIVACFAQSTAIVQMLLSGGSVKTITVNVQSEYIMFGEVTPLHICAHLGDIETLPLLLQHPSCNVRQICRGPSKAPPLHFACLGPTAALGCGTSTPSALRILLENGADKDVNLIPNGLTALELTALNNLPDHKELLFQYGADPNLKSGKLQSYQHQRQSSVQ